MGLVLCVRRTVKTPSPSWENRPNFMKEIIHCIETIAPTAGLVAVWFAVSGLIWIGDEIAKRRRGK